MRKAKYQFHKMHEAHIATNLTRRAVLPDCVVDNMCEYDGKVFPVLILQSTNGPIIRKGRGKLEYDDSSDSTIRLVN